MKNQPLLLFHWLFSSIIANRFKIENEFFAGLRFEDSFPQLYMTFKGFEFYDLKKLFDTFLIFSSDGFAILCWKCKLSKNRLIFCLVRDLKIFLYSCEWSYECIASNYNLFCQIRKHWLDRLIVFAKYFLSLFRYARQILKWFLLSFGRYK